MEQVNQVESPWFLAPLSLVAEEAACALCGRALVAGQVVTEDALGYLHESCYEEEITRYDNEED